VTVGHSRWDVELSGLPAQEIELKPIRLREALTYSVAGVAL
jgi:hypothetical protein